MLILNLAYNRGDAYRRLSFFIVVYLFHVAEMFIKEVTSVTLSDQGQGCQVSDRTPMNKSYSESYSLVEDCNLDLDSEELPSAKYF